MPKLTHASCAALLVALGACSTDDFVVSDSGTEDAPSDRADVAAEAAPPGCNLEGAFGTPTLVQYQGADAGAIPLQQFARLDIAERFVAFEQEEASGFRIYVGDIKGATVTGAQERVASAAIVHYHPALSPDGKTLYFAAQQPNAKFAIYRAGSDATSLSSATVWLADPLESFTAPFVANDRALYVGTTQGIRRVAIDGDGGAGSPENVPGLTGPNATSVVVNADETILYYGEGNVYAAANVYAMKKSGAAWVLAQPQPLALPPVDKPETPTWLSPDGCKLYVRAWKNQVDRAIYLVTKPPK